MTCPTSPSRPTTPSSPPACRCRSGPRRGTTRSRRPSWRRTPTMFTLGGQSEDVAGCSFYEGHVDVLARRHAAGVQLARLHRAGHAARRPGRHDGPRRRTSARCYDVQLLARRAATADDVGRRVAAGVAGRRLEAARRVPAPFPAATSRSPSAPQGTLAVSGTTGEIALVDPATGHRHDDVHRHPRRARRHGLHARRRSACWRRSRAAPSASGRSPRASRSASSSGTRCR